MIGVLFGFVFVIALIAIPLIALVRASRALAEVDRLRRDLESALRELSRRTLRQAPAAEPDRPVTTPPAEVIAPVEPPSPVAEPLPIAPAPVERPEPIATMPPPAKAESLEARIGSRWLLYLGVGAIVIAAAYFVKLAFDNEWITETMRVAIGGVAGLALVWTGRRFVRAGYPLYGQMLSGGGIAILYLSVYAAFNFYALIGRASAFGLMAVVTAGAAWLADTHRSQGLALMAVGGGFLTPFMIGGDTDAQAALFGYDAILVAGTAALSGRRDWPGLNLVSYWLAVVTIAGWFSRFYTDAAYLRTVLFLTVFCALFGYILARSWRSKHDLALIVRLVLATAPPAYYVTSVVLLFSHGLALLVFLVAATLVGLVIARHVDSAWGRLAIWIAVAWPLAVWIAEEAGPSWLWPGLTVAVAIAALHLVSQLEAAHRSTGDLRAPDVVLLHANGLGLYGLLYLLLEPRGATALAGAAAALAATNVALAGWARRLHEELPLHFGALAATLAAIAVALWTDGAWTLVGLSVEAAALVAIGLRTGREWLRLGGSLFVGLATLWFMGLEFQPVATDHMVLLNARSAAALVLIALLYGLTRLHRREAGPLAARAQQDSDYFLLVMNAVLCAAVTNEIHAFWELRGGGRPVELSQMASLSTAWALQAFGVIRVGLTRRRDWLRMAGGLLLLVPVAWLAFSLWADVFGRIRPPDGYVLVVNARAAAAVVIVAALCGLAAMHHRLRSTSADGFGREIAVAVLAASLVTLALLSAESSAFWYLRDAAGGDSRRVFHFARELTLSVLWAGFAASLVAAGIRRRYAPVRYLAIALFVATVVKVALVDLAQLERLYRVVSVMALGLLMLLASYLYQRHLRGTDN